MMEIIKRADRITNGTVISAVALLAAACIGFGTFLSAEASNKPLVILVRHGDAPGSGEPKGFTLGKCSTQRNLSNKGRKQASEIGDSLRTKGIIVSKVIASELCRTQQTAELMRVGPVESAPAFDDITDYRQQASELLIRERRILETWRGPGALVIVTHGSNIRALTGLHVDQGAIVVVKFNNDQLVASLFLPSE